MKLELKKLPKDTSLQNFTLHGHRGMSKRNETDGSQEMYLENGDYTLSILFDPSKVIVGNDDIAQKKMTKDFEQMLNDMIVLESKSSTSLTGSGTGIPCGGSAGILCPTGYFCDIVDLSTRIGHCTK